jgi:hypothetical protein
MGGAIGLILGAGLTFHRGHGSMTAGMILTGLLTLAAIGALVALTVFLVRRSRPRPPSAA